MTKEEIKHEIEKIGELEFEGNYLECLCCGEPKHRQREEPILAKDTWIYKKIMRLVSEVL